MGTPDRAPSVDEVMQLLASPRTSLAVDLLGLPLADRPRFFTQLLPRLQEAVGEAPERTLAALAPPPLSSRKLGKSEGLLWRRDCGAAAVLRLIPGKASAEGLKPSPPSSD